MYDAATQIFRVTCRDSMFYWMIEDYIKIRYDVLYILIRISLKHTERYGDEGIHSPYLDIDTYHPYEDSEVEVS